MNDDIEVRRREEQERQARNAGARPSMTNDLFVSKIHANSIYFSNMKPKGTKASNNTNLKLCSLNLLPHAK